MAYADATTGGRILLQGILPVQIVVSEAVEVGDLLGVSSNLWKRADANNSIYAELVAGTKGASGDTINAYRIAVIGGITGATKGNPIYLSDTVGETSESAGTVIQVVGVSLTATEILLAPGWSTGGRILEGASKLCLRDSGLYIHSSADGKLKISADGSGTDDITLDGSVLHGEMLMSDVELTNTISVDTTLVLADCGKTHIVDTDAKVITLPATAAGLHYRIVNGGADAAVLVTISPNAADKISGAGLTPADNKDLLNTKATAKKGDFVELLGDGVDGWVVTRMAGTWAREA